MSCTMQNNSEYHTGQRLVLVLSVHYKCPLVFPLSLSLSLSVRAILEQYGEYFGFVSQKENAICQAGNERHILFC